MTPWKQRQAFRWFNAFSRVKIHWQGNITKVKLLKPNKFLNPHKFHPTLCLKEVFPGLGQLSKTRMARCAGAAGAFGALEWPRRKGCPRQMDSPNKVLDFCCLRFRDRAFLQKQFAPAFPSWWESTNILQHVARRLAPQNNVFGDGPKSSWLRPTVEIQFACFHPVGLGSVGHFDILGVATPNSSETFALSQFVRSQYLFGWLFQL